MKAALALLLAASTPAAAPDVAARVMEVTRATRWTPVAAIRLRFPAYHPQGMVKIGDDFYVSSVEILELPKKLAVPRDGRTYDAGRGIGHLFRVGADGRLLGDVRLGEGDAYHPGGIDFDGRSLWVPVAEYRPNSRALIYRVAPDTLAATRVATVADHIGALAYDRDARRLVGMSWGSRRQYSWPIDRIGAVTRPRVNPSGYIDYQDCHGLGGRRMLCGGLAEYRMKPDGPAVEVGGLDLVDQASGRPVWQVPVPLWSPAGHVMTRNPFWAEATATGLRAWFIPEDDEATLYAFDAAAAVARPG